MLHQESVTAATLDLIRRFQKDPLFDQYCLVGGTALSLQIGHRKSIDIDYFTRTSFDNQTLIEHLEKQYGFSLQYTHLNTVKGFIDGILIDLLKHDYPYINEPILLDGVKMLSKQDIAAFKVNAITGSGTRAKDFIDIYFLLKEFTFAEIVGFYNLKYGQRNEFHAVKSLTYFDDLDLSNWPNLVLEKNLTLNKVKESIILQRNKFLREA
jgi:hypothetical protein